MTVEAEKVGQKGGLLKTIGGCVSAFGCVFSFLGLLVLVGIATNVFNQSVGPEATAAGTGALCCGLMTVLIGIAGRLAGGWSQQK